MRDRNNTVLRLLGLLGLVGLLAISFSSGRAWGQNPPPLAVDEDSSDGGENDIAPRPDPEDSSLDAEPESMPDSGFPSGNNSGFPSGNTRPSSQPSGLASPSGAPYGTAPNPGLESDSNKGAAALPEGRELVNMDFPELTDIKDIIKAVALWTGKNVILDRNVTGKVQIISPKKVTKEEAYQAFLSALNMLNLTTVETGKVIKVMKVRNAVKGNLKTYLGSSWAPRTDEIITQIIPLKYIDAKEVQSTLSRIVSTNTMIAYQPTNTLIISESGYKVRRVLEILELLDVQKQQRQLRKVPIKHADAKTIVDKINEILKVSAGPGKAASSSYHSFKLLTDERSNSVIIFGPPSTIQDIENLVKKFDVTVDDPSTQASIHVRPLDYADAQKLAGTLSSLASSGSNRRQSLHLPPISSPSRGTTSTTPNVADLGEGVKITADDSSNSLLITGNRTAYEALNTIIKKLDVRRSQVFVEAEILDINEDNGFNFGTSIFGGAGGSGTKSVMGWEAGKIAPLVVSQATAAAGGVASAANTQSVAQAFSSDMTIGILSGKDVTIPGLGSFRPGALINLLKSDANTRVLASPHILTSNNEEASISVGEKVFFKSSEINPATGVAVAKIEKEDVDLSLSIKPNISHSNYITLKLELDSNSIKSLTPEGLPLVNKRKTKQIVTVRNGQTIVISGLMESREYESYKKIPLLGDLPLLGWLFRNSTLSKSRKNLAIFLTVHAVYDAADLAAIYQEKIKERDNFLSSIYGSSVVDSDFYRSLPTAADGVYTPNPIDEAEEKEREKRREEELKANAPPASSEGATPEGEGASPAAEKSSESIDLILPLPGGDSGGGGGGFDGGGISSPPSFPSEGGGDFGGDEPSDSGSDE